MSPTLANSWKHALVTLVIQKAQEVINKQGSGYLGRTALQKMLYFIGRLGVPIPYRFDIYHYGPFCQDISHDMDWLIMDDVVEDISDCQKEYSNYRLGENGEALLRDFRKRLAPFEKVVTGVVEALSSLDPQDLELVATLDYLYQQERAKQIGPPDKATVVKRFMEAKDRFNRKQVEDTYDVLAQAQIFET